jgi:hypothetical protein
LISKNKQGRLQFVDGDRLTSEPGRLVNYQLNEISRVYGYHGSMETQSTTNEKPSWLALDERRALRIPAQIKVAIQGARMSRTAVTLTDVSSLGCRVVSPQGVTVGSFVTLSVTDFTSFNGWIAWIGDGTYGLDFAHELPAPVVERLTELGRYEG